MEYKNSTYEKTIFHLSLVMFSFLVKIKLS